MMLLKLLFLGFFVLLKKIRKKKNSVNPEDFDFNGKKIAVICSAGIGDALMATPLIYGIYKSSGNRKPDLISYPRVKEVFRHNKYLNDIYLFDKKKLFSSFAFYLKIRNKKYDMIFCAQPANTLFDAILSSTAQLNIKIDKINKSRLEDKINSLYDFIIRNDFSRHRVELNLDMLRKLGVDIEEQASGIDFFAPEEEFKNVNKKTEFLIGKKYICIHPGSGGAAKRWDAGSFIDLIKEINKMTDDIIVLLGGNEERELCDRIAGESENVLNLCGKLSLYETYYVLSGGRLMICNDTGIMHLGTACKIPLIALFGPTNPNHIGPYSRNSVVIKKGDLMNMITVEDVIEKIKSLKAV